MRNFGKTLFSSGFCVFMALNVQAETKGALQDLMTPQQYRAAGLHKLSDEERQVLYRWLRENQGKLPATAPAVDTVSPAPAATAASTAPAAPALPKATAAASPSAAAAAPELAAPAAAPVVSASSAPVSEGQPVATITRPTDNTAIEKTFGLPETRKDPEAQFQLHATVKEPFKGWSGKSVFYLDNGQVWRQRASGRYTYMGEDNRVVISKNRLGFYEMRLLDADRSVGVKRVK